MRKLLIAISLAVISSPVGAQGALSLQGLGYPPGGLSARAEGTGGGVAAFDALSLVNPATIARAGSAALFLQYSPEFRRVTAGTGTAKTTTARFPLFVGVLPMGQQWAGGLSSSTFLDRSTETSLVRRQVVGSILDTVNVTERSRVLGAINDVRLALAWSGSSVFRIGFGAHVFAGSNRIHFAQLFPDSAAYISTSQTGRISFAGFAGSVGVEYHPARAIGFALAARKGGDLTAQSGDTTIGILMALFRTKTPDSTVWKRFRSGHDGFTFTRTGDVYEAKVVANAERVVDLFYTLSELMAPAVDIHIKDERSQSTWAGQMVALPDVRDAVARLKVPLSTYGGVEITIFSPEDQLTLSAQLELFIYSRSDRWMYLLNSMNLEERASLEERLWGIESWERAPAPALSDAVAAAAERLSIKSA